MCICEGNFELEGLMGFDLYGKIVGVIGIGKIGVLFVCIMVGFGCIVLGSDVYYNLDFEVLGGCYVCCEELFVVSDVILLYCLFIEVMCYLVNVEILVFVKFGCILVNISCGGLVDIEVVIVVLKSGQLCGLVIDVYEQEVSLFFQDLFLIIIIDDVIQWLVFFFNVIVIGYQVFFIEEVIGQIMQIIIVNLNDFVVGKLLGECLVV